MKNLNVLVLLILALTVSSCSQPSNQGNDELSRTVEKLESKIDGLQKKLDAQEIKTRISFMQISSNPLFNTSWEGFLLASDDFWKNPVDVGLFECNRQLNPPSQTIPFTLKAEFFQSLPRVKTDLMLLVHNVAPV